MGGGRDPGCNPPIPFVCPKGEGGRRGDRWQTETRPKHRPLLLCSLSLLLAAPPLAVHERQLQPPQRARLARDGGQLGPDTAVGRRCATGADDRAHARGGGGGQRLESAGAVHGVGLQGRGGREVGRGGQAGAPPPFLSSSRLPYVRVQLGQVRPQQRLQGRVQRAQGGLKRRAGSGSAPAASMPRPHPPAALLATPRPAPATLTHHRAAARPPPSRRRRTAPRRRVCRAPAPAPPPHSRPARHRARPTPWPLTRRTTAGTPPPSPPSRRAMRSSPRARATCSPRRLCSSRTTFPGAKTRASRRCCPGRPILGRCPGCPCMDSPSRPPPARAPRSTRSVRAAGAGGGCCGTI